MKSSASRADERQQVVEELRAEVRRLGGDPEDDGSFLGKAHQRFEDLKAAITGRDEKAIINEVERGEDYLKEKFETALQSGEPERRNPDRRRALLSVGQRRPRPDQPAEARHGGRPQLGFHHLESGWGAGRLSGQRSRPASFAQ